MFHIIPASLKLAPLLQNIIIKNLNKISFMETKISNRPTASDVNYALIQTTIKNIEAFVAHNEYQFKDRTGLDSLTETQFNTALINLSLKKRKKLAAYIHVVNTHPTLEKVNKFLHFFMKTILNSDLRVRIVKSEKELAIQEKRKAYKAALKELLESPLYTKLVESRAVYKVEKGDFYKSRMLNNQTI
jgi:hypothetical protein